MRYVYSVLVLLGLTSSSALGEELIIGRHGGTGSRNTASGFSTTNRCLECIRDGDLSTAYEHEIHRNGFEGFLRIESRTRVELPNLADIDTITVKYDLEAEASSDGSIAKKGALRIEAREFGKLLQVLYSDSFEDYTIGTNTLTFDNTLSELGLENITELRVVGIVDILNEGTTNTEEIVSVARLNFYHISAMGTFLVPEPGTLMLLTLALPVLLPYRNRRARVRNS